MTKRRRFQGKNGSAKSAPLATSRALPEEERRALLWAAYKRVSATAARDRFLLDFLSRTGLRITEAIQLRARDFYSDYKPPFLRIETLKQRGRPRLHDVYLEPATVAMVRSWIRRMRIPPRGFLLAGMTRRNASRIFRRYAKLAGLPPGRTLHSLRHYRASYLYARTRDPEFVRSQLRHRSIATTQGYISIPEEQIQKYLSTL